MKRNEFLISLSGGATAGLLLGISPYIFWSASEIMNFRDFILETILSIFSHILPIEIMRFMSLSFNAVVMFMGLGLFFALAGTLILKLGSRSKAKDDLGSSFCSGFSVASGIFFFLGTVLWSRVVLFHGTARMFSAGGVICLSLCLLLSLVLSITIFSISRFLFQRKSIIILLSLSITLMAFYSFLRSWGASKAKQVVRIGQIQKVILLGLDGASWDVILPLIKENRLPNFKYLMETGSYGFLRTTLPWKSPIIWTSLATGMRKEKHGILDFVVNSPQTGEVIPVSIAARRNKAIWEVLTEAGRRVAIVNWYGAWPAEEVNGIFVSPRIAFKELPGRIFPEERLGEFASLVGNSPPTREEQTLKMFTDLGLYLLRKDEPDFFSLYFREPDHAHHLYWKYLAAKRKSILGRLLYKIDSRELSGNADKIDSVYEKLDEILGLLLKQAGDNSLVMVISDHGGGIKARGQLYFNLEPVLKELGLLKTVSETKKIAWQQTKIIDITKRPWLEERRLMLNLKAEGPLLKTTDKERTDFLLEVIKTLAWIKTTSGKPLFRIAKLLPDDANRFGQVILLRMNLAIGMDEDVVLGDKRLPISQIIQFQPRSGTHRMDGIFLASGPGIKSGARIIDAGILDITPTILYSLGLPIARDMDGRVLKEIFEPRYLKSIPLKEIPSYGEHKSEGKPISSSPEVDAQLIEELRALGYLH